MAKWTKTCNLQQTADGSRWAKAFCLPYSVRTHKIQNNFCPVSNMQKKKASTLQVMREPWIFHMILANREFLKITSGMQKNSLFTSITCILLHRAMGGNLITANLWGSFSKYHSVDNKHSLNPVVNVKANYTVSFVFTTTDLVHVSINSTLGLFCSV